MKSKLLFFIFVNILLTHCEGSCRGCVELDVLTFDKLIRRFPAVIVKFDIAYPYGDKHEAFANFAASVHDKATFEEDILVALVGIKDYGEKDNIELAKRFAVREQYPDIKLFVNQSTLNWINYPSDRAITDENLRQFIRDHSTVYVGLPGCLRNYDELAKEFTETLNDVNETRQLEIIEKAKSQMQELDDEKAKIAAQVYISIMNRIQAKGNTFVKAERQRVQQLLSNGKINESKIKELNVRLNILRSFNMLERPKNQQIKSEL